MFSYLSTIILELSTLCLNMYSACKRTCSVKHGETATGITRRTRTVVLVSLINFIEIVN